MKHPVTGDELSRGEWFSWKVQGVFRHWWFIISITIGSILWWITNGFGSDPGYAKWNAWASLMALIIESIVGMAMFAQTQRDAVILRRIDVMEEKILIHVENMDKPKDKED